MAPGNSATWGLLLYKRKTPVWDGGYSYLSG